MLPLLTDSCDLIVRSSSLTFVKRRGWFKPRKILQQSIPLDLNASQEELIREIKNQLEKPEWRCRTNIILTGDFVKFRLAKKDNRLDDAESVALLKHQFFQAYEKKVLGWSIFLSKSNFEKNTIACMVDQSLLTQLQLAYRSAGVKIASAEPSLVTWLNKVRSQLPQDGWVAIVDVGIVYALKVLDGEISHLRELSLAPNLDKANKDMVEKMLAREMMALGDDINTVKVSYYWVGQDTIYSRIEQKKQAETLTQTMVKNINVSVA